MNFTLNTVIKNRLFIQIEILKIPEKLKHGTAYMDRIPVLNIPIAYINQKLLNNLGIQSNVVKIYPYKKGADLLEEYTTFLLLLTDEPMLKILKDEKTKLLQTKYCIGTSDEWFKQHDIYDESVEAQVEVIPRLDIKPMY